MMYVVASAAIVVTMVLAIVRNDGRPNPPLSLPGEWGLFRLLQNRGWA